MESGYVRSIGVLFLAAFSVVAAAQQGETNTNTGKKQPSPYSRVDLFGGYAFLAPKGSVDHFNYQNINTGAVTSASIYFTKRFGVQFEGGFHPEGTAPLPPQDKYLVPGRDCVYTAQAGPIFRFPTGPFVPFVHVLGGAAKVGGPRFQPCTWSTGLTAGAGLDYVLPFWKNHLALRLIQADYEYMSVNFGPLEPHGITGGNAEINSARLSSGVALRLGDVAPYPGVSLACTANPAQLYAGDQVTVTAAIDHVLPGKHITYSWSSSTGKIPGNTSSVTIDTKGLAPGTYSVTARALEGKKAVEVVACSSAFVIKEIPPPTLTCRANPSLVNPGETSTITAQAESAANRPLTYSYSTTAGQLSGSGPSVQLGTAGVPPGVVTVVCTVADDIGQKTSGSADVTVSSPPIPPAAKPQALCSLSFARDKKRPFRVDNEARACLDDIALTLQHQPDARLVVVGEHDTDETLGQTLAAERAVNTKAYLTNEKGIDANRIDVRTSSHAGKQVENYLLPAGASFDQPAEPVMNVPVSKQPYSTAQSLAEAVARQQALEKQRQKQKEKPAPGKNPNMEGQSHPKPVPQPAKPPTP